MILCSVFGVKIYMETGFGGGIAQFALIGVMLWLAFDSDKRDTPKRSALVLTFGFLKGLCLGQFVEQMLYMNPQILYLAFGGTLSIFACFSLAALTARRRSYLYLGGICSSIITVMMLSSIFSLFLGSGAMHYSLQVYGGKMICINNFA